VNTLATDILFYPSIILLATGITALLLAMLFHIKLRSLNKIPQDLEANVFHKTFIVFNPYEARRKLVHKFMGAMPLLVIFGSLGLAVLILLAIQAGLLLAIITLILALDLMVIEEGPEAYRCSTDLIKAFKKKPTFGTGDIKTFHLTKKILPRLTTYYAATATFCIAVSLTLPAVFTALLSVFSQGIGAAVEGSSPFGGPVAIQIPVFAIAAAFILLELSTVRIRTKFLSFGITSPDE